MYCEFLPVVSPWPGTLSPSAAVPVSASPVASESPLPPLSSFPHSSSLPPPFSSQYSAVSPAPGPHCHGDRRGCVGAGALAPVGGAFEPHTSCPGWSQLPAHTNTWYLQTDPLV